MKEAVDSEGFIGLFKGGFKAWRRRSVGSTNLFVYRGTHHETS